MIKILLLASQICLSDSLVYLSNFNAIEARKMAKSFIPNSLRQTYLYAKGKIIEQIKKEGGQTVEVWLNYDGQYLTENEIEKLKALFLKEGFTVEYYRDFSLKKVYFRIGW